MSLEAATTIIATPIAERLAACLWDNNVHRASYVTSFEDNHKSLRLKMRELRGLRDHVKRRIEVNEASQQVTRTPVVAQWLERVETFEQEVTVILQLCSREVEQRCCGDYCPKNWWARYKLGKKVCAKLKIVMELISHGNFDVVADKSLPSPVEVKNESQTVGMDEIFREVWSWVADVKVKIIGIYGMGGVGKTTLLKKINNAFLKKDDDQTNQASTVDVVIWVVVSSEFSIQNVQKELGKRLGLTWSDDEDQYEKAQRILNVLSKKRFVILLDDVWEAMKLEAIGIPTHNNSKVVFTTRSEKLCGEMEVSKKVKMNVLASRQAWELFQRKLGEEVLDSHPELLKLAGAVAAECGGLPLALTTIGRAMATKKTPHEWNYALRTLQKYASGFSGMEEKVLSILKFSYDSLEDDTVRCCFRYFSLYPEDHNIHIRSIIFHWIGEGFLDNIEDMDDAVNKGYDIIGSLKAACLLESGDSGESYSMMHDIVRDLALWVACECGREKNKFLVQAGVGLTEAPNTGTWKEAEMVSMMENDIKELTGAPVCPRLHTLMLQNNYHLSIIHDDFFKYIPSLKVLNLSRTRIANVPKSIGGLLQLEYLNLCGTKIETVPNELGNLVKLKYLNLASTRLKTIQRGLISCFPRLQVLRLGDTYLNLDGGMAADLESLEQLRDLGLSIKGLPTLLLSDRLSSCIHKLKIVRCKGLTELALLSSLILRKLKKLRWFIIRDCLELENMMIDCVNEDNDDTCLLMTLEGLHLRNLPKLNKIMWAETVTDLHFKYLYEVRIVGCGALKDISWLVLVPFLSYLLVKNCKEVEQIMPDRFSTLATKNPIMFSRVRDLTLSRLPKLRSITGSILPFPSLKQLVVSRCPLLKKLPFASSANKPLLRISGAVEWWNELKWEDETLQSSFQPFFFEHDDESESDEEYQSSSEIVS